MWRLHSVLTGAPRLLRRIGTANRPSRIALGRRKSLDRGGLCRRSRASAARAAVHADRGGDRDRSDWLGPHLLWRSGEFARRFELLLVRRRSFGSSLNASWVDFESRTGAVVAPAARSGLPAETAGRPSPARCSSPSSRRPLGPGVRRPLGHPRRPGRALRRAPPVELRGRPRGPPRGRSCDPPPAPPTCSKDAGQAPSCRYSRAPPVGPRAIASDSLASGSLASTGTRSRERVGAPSRTRSSRSTPPVRARRRARADVSGHRPALVGRFRPRRVTRR